MVKNAGFINIIAWNVKFSISLKFNTIVHRLKVMRIEEKYPVLEDIKELDKLESF